MAFALAGSVTRQGAEIRLQDKKRADVKREIGGDLTFYILIPRLVYNR